MTEQDRELINRIVRRTTACDDDEWSMNIHKFDWVPGVGLYGLFKAYEATGEGYILDFLKNWVDRHLEEAYDLQTVNSTAPLTTVLKVYKETGKEQYLQVCAEIANQIMETAPRTPEGGLEHTVTENVPEFKGQIWADTLFMAAVFFAELYSVTKEEKYKEEAALQLRVHHKRLKDQGTGAFYHGYNYNRGDWMSGALWGRANAWVLVSTFEIIDLTGGELDGKDFVVKSVEEQANALRKFQRENGMFGTLLDHEDSYDEASATAGIAYGLIRGIRMGYLPEEFYKAAEKAVEAVKRCVNARGEVEHVSRGTPVMKSQEEYKRIKRNPTLYGQGLSLLAISI